jgi:desulfoferrodoxin (superoxide reductase-like protein)
MGLEMKQKADKGYENEDEETLVIEDEDQSSEQTTSEYQSTGDQDEGQDSEDGEGESDEVIVSIGEEAPPPEEQTHAPEWVRELRKTNRELQRQNRELQGKLQSTAQTENKPVVLGKKPSLDDYDYDAEKFEEALTTWFERKRQADDANARQEAEVMNQQKAWKAKLDNYGKAKAELRVKDFEDAEAVAQELFNVTQQGVMLQGADNPALVVYALGKNPKKAKELSDIKDPVKFAFAVAKLEKELKVTNRRAAPPPERIVTGTGRVSGAVDSTLERLREEAARTGNMTKVIQYKVQKRAASK